MNTNLNRKEGETMGFGQTANKSTAPQEKKGKAPVDKVKIGGVSCDTWENDGEHSKFYTHTLQRSYKQGSEWKHTNSLRTQDLPKAILALQKAYEKSFTTEQDESD